MTENLSNTILLKNRRRHAHTYKLSDYCGLLELLYPILGREFKSINSMFLYCCLDQIPLNQNMCCWSNVGLRKPKCIHVGLM